MARDEYGNKAIAQPLGAPARDHNTLREWTARTRTTAMQALRYSRFVAVMKRALPMGALVIVALVVAYALIPRHIDRTMSLTYQQRGMLHNDLTMTKPRLSGTDQNGNPFVVTADKAIQDPVDRHRATLLGVDADIQFDGGQWLNASAAKGVYDMDASSLKLDGGISLYTDSGYELHTTSADVDLKKNVVSGQQKVTGHGPLGAVSADSFHFDRLKKQVKLDGHVHMTMYPKKTRGR